MKIDRRKFLAYFGAGVGGAAAGINFTPSPWKTMDDVAIWTQNWWLTPVPEDGLVSYVQSVCSLCSGGCGINVRKVNDRAVKIDGLENHPVNKGGLCPLGLSGLQYLYGPARVTSPMKRSGKRGQGQFTKISWEEALSTVTKKLSQLREKGRPQSVAWITGSDRGTIPNMIFRFLSAYGSPNFLRTSSAQDTLEQTIYLTQGQHGTAGYDIKNADYILSFGTGILDGWGSPGQMYQIYAKNIGLKTIVQIEPRLSDTAAKASEWIGIKPGTEGALALGIAHVIIQESLYNKNFVENFAFGFEDWSDETGILHEGFKTMAATYTPENVSAITGISKTKIIDIARQFAKSDKPIALYGRGHGTVPGSIDECLAIHTLNALVGNINQEGGVFISPEKDYAKWPEAEFDEIASKGMQQPRIDGAGSEQFPNTRFLLSRLPEILNEAKGDSPVEVLLVTDANPIYTLPDTTATQKAFDRIPFIASFSPYLDETARFANISHPYPRYLERF